MPEVNRIVNAFIAGANAVNPNVDVKTTFINSWFDPAAAKEAAWPRSMPARMCSLPSALASSKLLLRKDLYAFGNMSDQKDLAPENVVSGPVWNMEPTVDYILSQVAGGTYTAQDLKDFSMVAKGGATPCPDQHRGHGRGAPALIERSPPKKPRSRRPLPRRY